MGIKTTKIISDSCEFHSFPLCTHSNYPITIPNKRKDPVAALTDQKIDSRIQKQAIKELVFSSIAPGLLITFISNSKN
jgi:hypothetical protein